MPIEFVCTQCKSELRVREQDVGKKARCPRCGMIHDVPGGDGARTDESIENEVPSLPDQETVYYQRQLDEQFTEHPPGQFTEPSPGQFTEQSRGQFVEQSPEQLADQSQGQFEISGYERWMLKTPDGQVYGPVDRSELDSWKNEGRISSSCLLQTEGQTHWQSALVVFPELAQDGYAAASSAGNPYGHRDFLGTQVYGQGGHGQATRGQSARSGFARPNNGGAVLVMGILGLIFVFIPIFALIAWSMGYSERRAISRGEASNQYRWMVDAGYVLGIAGSIIGCLTFFSCCLRFGIG